MRNIRNWEDVIPSYMEHYNNYFSNQRGDKYHLLFVEGKGDNKYFYDFFNSAYDKTNHKYDLRILREDILFDFSNKFKSVDAFGRLTYGRKKIPNLSEEELEKIKQSTKDIKESLKQITETVEKNGKQTKILQGRITYQNFYFVSECLKDFNNKNYKYIDCFGIVDRDCNQHRNDVDDTDQLCQTKYHDRETNLMRDCFVDFVNEYAGNNKNATRQRVAKILLFTTKQGIAERTSLNCGYDHKMISNKTKIYFNKNSIHERKIPRNFTNIEFDKHLRSLLSIDIFKDKAENNIIRECNILLPNENINTESEFNNKLSKIIIEWLEGNKDNESVIDEIFRLSNGHYILQQLICAIYDRNRLFIDHESSDELLRVYDEDDLMKLIFKENKENIEGIFNISPLKDYKEYRDSLTFNVRKEHDR